MLVKCICTNCAGHLEFEEENAGQRIACPHCRFETVLTLPGTEVAPVEPQSWWSRPLMRRLIAGAVLVLAGIAGIFYVLHRWGVPWVLDTFTSVESATTAMVLLVCACLALPFVLFWLVLPVVLSFQLRQLTLNLARIASEKAISSEAQAEPVSQEAPEPQSKSSKD